MKLAAAIFGGELYGGGVLPAQWPVLPLWIILPIILYNHRYRLVTRKDWTRLFTSSALLPR